ncbi:MAG: hypothetical protein AAF739_04935 [Pseudomonadota bacterium]
MASPDLRFIKNLEMTPVSVEYPVSLYAVDEGVRDRIVQEIRSSGQAKGQSCIDNIYFDWRVAWLGEDLQELSGDDVRPDKVKRRIVVVNELAESA